MKEAFGSFDELELSKDEQVLWQGRPRARSLAIHVFHMRWVAAWFAVLFLTGAVMRSMDGQSLAAATASASRLIVPLIVSVLLLSGLAWLYSRTTRYMVTNRRVFIQFGAVLPMTLTIPLVQIASAGLKIFKDGTGDLPLSVVSTKRLAFLLLWPHVRPWRLTHVEPMLRCIPDPKQAADILAKALVAASSPALEAANPVTPQPRQLRLVRTVATAA